MIEIKKLLLIFVVSALGLFSFTACSDNSADDMEEAAEDVGDAAKNVGENVGEAVEDAGKNIQEAAE